MGAVYFNIKDAETGEVLGRAHTYNGGGGSGIISRWETEDEDWTYDNGYRESRLAYWDYDYEPDEWASEVVGRPAKLVATVEYDDNDKVICRYDEDGFGPDGRDWLGYDGDGFNEYGYGKEDENYYWDTDENGNDIRVYEDDDDASSDPLSNQEPLWSSDNGFSGGSEPSGPIASSENGFGGPWKKALEGLGNTFGGLKHTAKSAVNDMPKTGDIDVSAYDYVRNGKRVHVDAHKRKRS